MCLLYLQCFCINRICPHIYSSVGGTPEAYGSRRCVSVCVLEYFSQLWLNWLWGTRLKNCTVTYIHTLLLLYVQQYSSLLVYSWCVHVLVCVYWSTIKTLQHWSNWWTSSQTDLPGTEICLEAQMSWEPQCIHLLGGGHSSTHWSR